MTNNETMTQMPTLIGSEKQVAWAERIRAEAVAQWGAAKLTLMADEQEDWSDTEPLPEDHVQRIEQGITDTDEFIRRQTRAAFWIDNRGIEFASIYKKLGRGIHTGIEAKGSMVYPNGGVGPLSQ